MKKYFILNFKSIFFERNAEGCVCMWCPEMSDHHCPLLWQQCRPCMQGLYNPTISATGRKVASFVSSFQGLLLLMIFLLPFHLHAQKQLAAPEVEVFSQKAIEKAKDFGAYIEVISDKTTPISDAEDAIELAVDLFIDDARFIEVSSIKREEIRSYPVRDYLRRLQLLKYSKVEVQWYDVHYASQLRLGEDGRYYGTITIYQKFKGYVENQVIYEDVTRKDIEVVLERIPKNIGGKTQKIWEVFLGDIKVSETRKQ